MADRDEGSRAATKDDGGTLVTKVCRDRSPRLLVTKRKRAMARNGIRFRKIHRLNIQSTASCKIVETDSPNLLFAKFATDITCNLQYKCPHLLTKYYIPNDVQSIITDYVMAPTDEDTYSRARIIKVVSGEEGHFCLVVFIDHGYCSWVHIDCLVEMDHQFFYNPWQAFAFSLFGVRPVRRLDEMINVKKFRLTWTVDHLNILRAIIERYDEFLIQSVFHMKDHIVEEAFPYNLFGCDGDRRVDIALQFASECRLAGLDVEVDRSAIMFEDHKEFRTKFSIEPKLDVKTLQVWQREISSIWGATLQGNPDRENKTIDISAHEYLSHPSKVFDLDFKSSENRPTPLVTTFDNNLLIREYVLNNDGVTSFVLLSTEKKSFKEFYIMPLKVSLRKEHLAANANAVAAAKADLKAFSNSLDAFYVENCNRRPVNPQKTCKAIVDKIEQYAIYELPHNVDLVHGRYRRVMLVGLKLISADHYDVNSWMVEVVYVDFGGSEWVSLSLLLQIHSKHCVQEPFAVQIYPKFEFVTAVAKEPHMTDCLNAIFNACVPVTSILQARLIEYSAGDKKFDPKLPHRRPNVLTLNHMGIEGTSYYLEEAMKQCLVEVRNSGRLVDLDGIPRKVKITRKGGSIFFSSKYQTKNQKPIFEIDYESCDEEEDPETPIEDRAIRYFRSGK